MRNEAKALAVAQDYHRAWNEGRFADAAERLSERLAIEVPINAYATKAQFMEAVERTRGMTSRVELLAELGSESEAVLLYDMTLPFGEMRVAEHFTVEDGRISRIRQIHDTAAIRAAMGTARG
jgi:ketosteroid isomerase-like protein